MGGPGQKRIAELDGLRGLAILLVLAWHYLACQGAASSPLRFAWSGVDLFFVLSGFLIGGILIDQRNAPNVAAVFWTRRACRILPLYAITLALFALGLALNGKAWAPWLFDNAMGLSSYLTLTQNFAMAGANTFGANWLGITWSLAVEEQFYVFLAVVLLTLPPRWGLAVIVATAGLAPVLRSLTPPSIAMHALPWMRGDAMLLGVLCAYLVRASVWQSNRRAVIVGALGVCLTMAVLVPILRSAPALLFTPLALLYASLLLLTVAGTGSALSGPLRLSWLMWLGQRSFALYLVHQPVSGLLHAALLGRAPAIVDAASLAVTGLALVISAALAEVSFRTLERHFIALGQRAHYGERAYAAPFANPTARPLASRSTS